MVRPVDMIPGLAPVREVIVSTAKDTFTVRVTPPASIGGATFEIELTKQQYYRYMDWRMGKFLIQEALPELTDDERDGLLMGLVP